MNRCTLVLVGLLAITLPVTTHASQSGHVVALRAAQETETVKGDLKAAMEQYRALAKSPDRSVAAEALVRLAGCHQKLGNAEARAIFERVVREYADQAEAVRLARAALASEPAVRSRGPVYRRVWDGSKTDTGGAVSPDGRYLSYTDWETGDLALHDLVTGADRRLTNKGTWGDNDQFAERSVFSRDGRQIAYCWYNGKRGYEVRIVDVKAPGIPNARVAFTGEDIEWVAPFDWAPDGKSIVALVSRHKVRPGLTIISLSDGSLRTLLQVNGLGITLAGYSPDGRFVAFDQATGPDEDDRDVFLIGADGAGSTGIAVNPGRDAFMGWSPDGTRVLFASDRAGALGLWGQVVHGGGPVGDPELLRRELAHAPLGVTSSGRLFLGDQVGTRNIFVAPVDLATGKLTGEPVAPVRDLLGANEAPDWSADGSQLSYMSARQWIGRKAVLGFLDVPTGKRRLIPVNLVRFHFPRLAPDGGSVLVQGQDFEGQQGIYLVDATTGDTRLVVGGDPNAIVNQPQWSPDGRKIYYGVFSQPDRAIREHDLQSGAERELLRGPFAAPIVSPDGQWVATVKLYPDKSSSLVIAPIAGGQPTELMRISPPQGWQLGSWTPDSHSLIANRMKNETDGQKDTLIIPRDGGPARPLAMPPAYSFGAIRVHPDGNRIAYLGGELRSEVWVLENFLPADTAEKH